MRILHIVGGLDRGGVETWLVQVMRQIDRTKYQFDFMVQTDRACAYDEEVRAMGARILPCLSPSRPIVYGRNFLKLLREYGPYDVVHSHVHYFSGYVMALAKLAGVGSRVAHSHSDTAVAERGGSIVRQCYQRLMTVLILTFATKLTAVSGKAASDLFGKSWRNRSKVELSHLGIDLRPFCGPLDRERVRRALGIDDRNFVVGHVGSFCDAKNHGFLLKIVAELVKREPSTLLLLVGDGPLRPRIEANVRNLGLQQHVKLLGVRSDVPAIMRGAMDVFLFPSLYEGLPLALLEAQAAGLACVTSDSVTDEASVIEGLVTVLSLSTSPASWAECLLARKSQRKPADKGFPKDFTVAASIKRLCTLYDNSTSSHDRV